MSNSEEHKLRELLWLRHGCSVAALYGDDGEMQCGRCLIDFKRLSAAEIEERFRSIAMLAFIKEQQMAKRKNRPKAMLAPSQNRPMPSWNPSNFKSKNSVTCDGCGEKQLFWTWDFAKKAPLLINKWNIVHPCPTPRRVKDIFPGWCMKCAGENLSWVRGKYGFELIESYGLPHCCEQDPPFVIQDMKDAKCKACKTTGLFWVVVNTKYHLVHLGGLKHFCAEFGVLHADWAEAKRMNYAVEKAWINSHPDGYKCTKCKGEGRTYFSSKNKRTMARYNSSEPILMQRPCLKCKCLGTFSVEKKAFYLKELRKKYWPFKSGTHKWKKHPNA